MQERKRKVTEGEPMPLGRHTDLLMGGPKTGKTTLARWLCEDPLWWAWDPDGIKSVRGSLDEEKIIWVPRKRPGDHWQRVIEDVIPSWEGRADAIVVDDLTFMSRLLTKEAAGWSHSLAQIQHYGKSIAAIRDIIEKLKFDYLDMNIIYISTVLFIYDKEENLMSLPNVFGKDTFAPEIPAMVDNVFYCMPAKKSKKKGVERDYIILTESDGVKMAGNRLSPAGEERLLDVEFDVTIYKDAKGGEWINPVRDKLKPILERR